MDPFFLSNPFFKFVADLENLVEGLGDLYTGEFDEYDQSRFAQWLEYFAHGTTPTPTHSLLRSKDDNLRAGAYALARHPENRPVVLKVLETIERENHRTKG